MSTVNCEDLLRYADRHDVQSEPPRPVVGLRMLPGRRFLRRRPVDTSSSASATRRSSSCTPTAFAICRLTRRRSSGISTRRRSPAATSTTIRARHALEMRDAARGDHHACRRASTRRRSREIQRYTKLFWINSGPYNNLTRAQVRAELHAGGASPPRRTPRQRRARRSRPLPARRSIALLARLHPMFFDPTVDPMVTAKTPGAGQDILTASANNLYVGVIDGGPRRLRASSTRSTRGS